MMPAIAYTKDEVLLHLEGVSLTLGDKLILRDVNAEIQNITRPDCVQGQVVAFLGPSGIGKTQLSRLIAGLTQPSSGRILLDGGKPTHKGLVGMVPQNYVLFEWTTVEGNFAIAGRQGGLDEQALQKKLAPLVETFGLQPYLKCYPAQLSGGTRQRVAIVRQLLCSDHYVVMDEPFSGLDPRMKHRACELITKVANLDTLNTVILVTHDITEGLSVADSVWLMGQEQDAAGKYLPGARIVETFDLAAAGLCWHPNLRREPEFLALVADVVKRFETLAP